MKITAACTGFSVLKYFYFFSNFLTVEGYAILIHKIVFSSDDVKTMVFDGSRFKKIEKKDFEGNNLAVENVIFRNTQIEQIPEALFTDLKHIKKICFINNPLLKELPKSFYALENLQLLTTDKDLITELPANFKSLKRLSLLYKNTNSEYKILQNLSDFTNLTTLDLSSAGLVSIPAEVYLLKQLKTIVLSKNAIQSLTKEILDFSELVTLDLSDNKIVKIDGVIIELMKKLETIDLSKNLLTSLYEQTEVTDHLNIFKIKSLDLSNNDFSLSDDPLVYLEYLLNLETLTLIQCGLIKFPATLLKAHSIKHLDLSSNKIDGIPVEISAMKIETLKLRRNEISLISDSILGIKTLKTLDLSDNKLKNIEPLTKENELGISCLPYLENLNISINYIDKIPANITILKKLKNLNISLNRLIELPVEFLSLELETLNLKMNKLCDIKDFFKPMLSLKNLTV